MEAKTIDSRYAFMTSLLKIIDDIDVKNPCGVCPSKFKENDLGVHCTKCEKQVYDLSQLTRFETFLLVLSKRNNQCIKVTKNRNGKVIFRKSILKRLSDSFKNLAIRIYVFLITTFTSSSAFASPYNSDSNYHSEINYGDTRIAPAISNFLGYIEGTFGAAIMIVSFIASVIFFVLNLFKKSKGKLVLAFIFLTIAISMYILRILVADFFQVDDRIMNF